MDEQIYPQRIYAGLLIRLAAAVIDMIVTAPLVWAMLYLAGIDITQLASVDQLVEGLKTPPTRDQKIADFISWTISIAYSVYFLSSKKQATIGKQMMNIYVGTRDGAKLTVNRAFARFFASLLSGITIVGLVMIAFTREKTALHDILCNTRVFYRKKN